MFCQLDTFEAHFRGFQGFCQQGLNWGRTSYCTMFCPYLYLRGQLIFWGYFFTGGAFSYRPFGFWCHSDPKWPYWGLASMEVRWPQSSETCKVCPKSAYMVKFWCWLVNRGLRYWAASNLYHIEVWPQLRPLSQNPWKPLKCASKVPSWQNMMPVSQQDPE